MTFQPTKPISKPESSPEDVWQSGKGWRVSAYTLLIVNVVMVLGWLVMFGSAGPGENVSNAFELIVGIIRFGFGLGAMLFGSVLFMVLGVAGIIAAIVATVQSNSGLPQSCAALTLVAHVIMTSVPIITLLLN